MDPFTLVKLGGYSSSCISLLIDNRKTCTALGSLLLLSSLNVPMYTSAIVYYHYRKSICDVSDEDFRGRKVEKRLHGGIWFVSLSITIAALVTDSIGNSCSQCFSADYDTTEIDVNRNWNIHQTAAYFVAFQLIYLIVLFLSFASIVRNVSLWNRSLIKRNREFGGAAICVRRRISAKILTPFSSKISGEENVNTNPTTTTDSEGSNAVVTRNSRIEEGSTLDKNERIAGEELIRDDVSDREKIQRNALRTILLQLYLYVMVYLLVYTPILAYMIISLLHHRPPLLLLISSAITFPLGGFFKLVMFTRPATCALRTRKKCSWFKAFVEVVRAGGEVPDMHNSNCGAKNSSLKIGCAGAANNDSSVKFGCAAAVGEPQHIILNVLSLECIYANSSHIEVNESNIGYRPRNEWDAARYYIHNIHDEEEDRNKYLSSTHQC